MQQLFSYKYSLIVFSQSKWNLSKISIFQWQNSSNKSWFCKDICSLNIFTLVVKILVNFSPPNIVNPILKLTKLILDVMKLSFIYFLHNRTT